MKNKRRVVLFSVLGLVLVGAVFVQREPKEIELTNSRDFSTVNNFEELSNESDIIVEGIYTGHFKSWNMARNPNNIYEEDMNNYVEGRLFDFEVEKIIKGHDVAKNIKVNHRYKETEIVDLTSIGEGKQVVDINDPLYIKPQTETRYILFLKQDEDFDNYYGSVEPWILKIEEEGVIVQTKLDNKSKNVQQAFKTKKGNIVIINEELPPLDDSISKDARNFYKKLKRK